VQFHVTNGWGATLLPAAIGGVAGTATTANKCCGRARPLLEVARSLKADTLPLGGALVPQGGRTAIGSSQFVGNGLTTAGSGFGHSERTYRRCK